jgi:TonB family protein
MENAFNSNNSSNSDDANNNNNPGINSNNNGPNSGFGKLNGNRQLIKVDPESRDNMYGTVILKITVNENGIVTDINLVSTNCDQCVKAATDAIKKWQYEPLPGSGYQIGIITIEFKQK